MTQVAALDAAEQEAPSLDRAFRPIPRHAAIGPERAEDLGPERRVDRQGAAGAQPAHADEEVRHVRMVRVDDVEAVGPAESRQSSKDRELER